MPADPRPLHTLLHSCHTLRQLGAHLAQQQRLLEAVRSRLPDYLAPHCRAAVRSGRRLTLYAASSAWASRLRYLAGSLERGLPGELAGVTDVRIRVLGGEVTPSANGKPEPARPLSPQNQRLLRATAQTIQDAELAAALERLARHGE